MVLFRKRREHQELVTKMAVRFLDLLRMGWHVAHQGVPISEAIELTATMIGEICEGWKYNRKRQTLTLDGTMVIRVADCQTLSALVEIVLAMEFAIKGYDVAACRKAWEEAAPCVEHSLETNRPGWVEVLTKHRE